MTRFMGQASRRSLVCLDIEAKARAALKLSFPDCRTMAGPVTGYAGVGFGIVTPRGERHAVRVGSFAEYPDAIGALKAKTAA